MEPVSAVHKSGMQTLRDVVPIRPKPAAQTTPQVKTSTDVVMKPEIVDNIPVKLQSDSGTLPSKTAPNANPITAETKEFNVPGKDDIELEQVLKDVSSSVKESEAPAANPKPAKHSIFKKNTSQKNPEQLKNKENFTPVAAIAAALIVASVLIASALIIFSKG